MARTNLTVQTLYANGKLQPMAFTAGHTDGHAFDNSGHELVLFKSTDAATKAATVVSVADHRGRTGDLAITIPAAGDDGCAIAGPFSPELFNQPDGKVHINIPDATGVKLAIVRTNTAFR